MLWRHTLLKLCCDQQIFGIEQKAQNRFKYKYDADPALQDSLWLQYTHTHGLQKSREGKGNTWPLSQEENAGPLPWQAFIVFLGPLHQRRSSFTMQRFVLDGYLLQIKERVYIKGGYLQCKGRSGPNCYAPYLEGLARF